MAHRHLQRKKRFFNEKASLARHANTLNVMRLEQQLILRKLNQILNVQEDEQETSLTILSRELFDQK